MLYVVCLVILAELSPMTILAPSLVKADQRDRGLDHSSGVLDQQRVFSLSAKHFRLLLLLGGDLPR